MITAVFSIFAAAIGSILGSELAVILYNWHERKKDE